MNLKYFHWMQVDVLFELIKGLIKDIDGTLADEVHGTLDYIQFFLTS